MLDYDKSMLYYDGTRSRIDQTMKCLLKFPVDFPFINLRTVETVVLGNEVQRTLTDTYRKQRCNALIKRASTNGKVHQTTA